MNKFGQKVSFIFALLLLGCAGTPDLPKLPGKETPSIDQVIIGSTFTTTDARNIFGALNKNGRLDSLKQWFTAPDSELRVWSDFFDLYFYQDALKPSGLISLLENRTKRQGFRMWQALTENWRTSSTFRSEQAALLSVLNSMNFPLLAHDMASFLAPELYSLFKRTATESESSYKELGEWKAVPPESAEAVSKDLLEFFSNPENIAALSRLGSTLLNSNVTENFLYSLRDGRLASQGSATPFEGFSYGIGKRIATHEIKLVFELLNLLNRPSNGIFSVAHATLEKNPALGRIFAKQLDPKIAKAAFYYIKDKIKSLPNEFWSQLVRKEPSQPPTKEFITLFSILGSGIENLTSQGSSASLLEKTPVYLASLLITERIEEVLKTSPFVPGMTVQQGTINLLDPEEPGKSRRLNSRLANDLDAMPGMGPFKEVLNALVVQETFGSRLYTFNELKNASLETLLLDLLKTVQETHRFADAAGLLMPLLRTLTLSESASLTLQHFESPNMLDSLHRFLGGVSLETWNAIDHFLFEVLELGKLQESEKQLVLQLYLENEEVMHRATDLIDRIQLLHTFNQPIKKDLPSVLSLFHRFLSNTRPKFEERQALSALIGFVSETRILSIPAVSKTLESGQPLAMRLYQLSFVSKEEADQLSQAIETGLSMELLKFAELLSKKSPNEFQSLCRSLWKSGWELLPDLDALTPEERRFLIPFLKSTQFKSLWEFLQKYSSRENLHTLVLELRGLVKNGALLDAFQLLARIENPLLRKFARVVEKMLVSGEFEALLQALDNTVTNSR